MKKVIEGRLVNKDPLGWIIMDDEGQRLIVMGDTPRFGDFIDKQVRITIEEVEDGN